MQRKELRSHSDPHEPAPSRASRGAAALLSAALALSIAGCAQEGDSFDDASQVRKPIQVSGQAIASTIEGQDFLPQYAFDGNLQTRWSSAFFDPQWIQVDLGSVTVIDHITLHWETAHARDYDIQVSSDGSSWNTAYTNPNSDGGVDEISLSTSGRFVRMYSRSRGTGWGNSLWEFQIFSPDGCASNAECNDGNPCTTDTCSSGACVSADNGSCNPTERLLSTSASASASSLEVSQLPASAAVDGNPSTRWASGYWDPQWLTVDLGAVYSVSRVRLLWEAAFGRDYQLQTSQNGSSWSTVRSVNGGDGGVDEHTNLNVDARYVRMYGTARGTEWGYSLWELEVYGTERGDPPEPDPQCRSSADCNDGNVCTNDSCNGGVCYHANNANPCSDDGNTCTVDVCSAGVCTHPDSGTCEPDADIFETMSNLSNWSTYIRQSGGSATVVSTPQAEDGTAASLLLPGNPAFGSNDAAGPGFASEIALRDDFLYGTFETRVRFSSCSPSEEVVDGIFTYFNNGTDWNGNGISDNSEIDIEFLCGTPHILWLTVYTDFDSFEPGRLRKLSSMIDMRNGSYTVLADWPPTVIDQGTIPGLSIPGFPGSELYTVGFDWRENHVQYYMRRGGQKINLFTITDPSRIPRRTSEFLMNIWHANGHWTDGSAADYPANDSTMLVDWVKIWR